jgi:hypothetical protein
MIFDYKYLMKLAIFGNEAYKYFPSANEKELISRARNINEFAADII